MSEVSIDNTSVEAPAYAPLGEALAAARKAKKLTQQDVSNNLRLSVKQITDIENNEFSALPQPMIRGFIRNYARLLELDAEPLLESYRARVPDKAPKSVSVQSSMYEVVSGKESQPWLKYILGSILILLFLLSWVLYIDYMPKPVKPAAEKPTETVVSAPQPTEIALPEVALPAAERQAEAEAAASGAPADSAVAPANSASNQAITAAATATVPPAANSINSVNASAANATSATAVNTEAAKTQGNQAAAIASKPSTAVDFNTLKEKAAQNTQAANVVAGSSAIKPVAPATPLATAAPTATTGSAPAQKVSFSITEKTWIQATDKSGKVIFERILQAGSTDGFDGQPPFNVVIGNAKATKLSYLGKSVDLTPNTTQNNVARIKLE